MISALLLSVALAGAPADSAPAAVQPDDPAVRIWINNDRRFLAGDDAKVQVKTRDDGYLLVLHVDTEGHLRVLFPLDPRDDDFVRGGRKYEVRGRGGRESFTADSREGRGYVYAAVSPDPFKFDGYVLGDHWDYRALSPSRLPTDPEADLNDLVRRVAQGDFDYDILSYDVLDRVAYSGYSTPYYTSGYDYGCFSCGYGYGSGLSVGLFFGRPYYRRFYDPFYDPFFYDPYYYPVYYQPFYHRPFYPHAYYPRYAFPYDRYYGYYNVPGRRLAQPYTPYRFRGNDPVLTGYRSRGFSGVRSVNTVYVPPRSRVIQPGATANPIRRATDAREVARPEAAPTARRNGQRTESPAARDRQGATAAAEGRRPEAHRSGEPELRRNSNPSARQESWPQDVSPRRATPRDDGSSGRGVTARRAEVDRPEIERAPLAAPSRERAPAARAPEARSPSRAEPRAAPPPSDDRSRGSWGGGSGGSGRSPSPAPSGGGGGGGGGGRAPSSGGGGGGGGGGGHRR
jgi:hypothetical protein